MKTVTIIISLQVMIISDRETSIAAASLHVGAGSLSDPKEYQGLARFTQLMLETGINGF
jgi:secreted Zn-dependent insulinase-like peptidase